MQHDHDNGCWSCGNLEGRVRNVEWDEDGNKVRRRQCTKCGDIWLTEERRLARSVRWFHRAASQVERQRKRRGTRHRCRYCHGRYEGTWLYHVKSSVKHAAWKAQRAVEVKEYKRLDALWRYRNDPVYRQTQLDRHRSSSPRSTISAATTTRADAA